MKTRPLAVTLALAAAATLSLSVPGPAAAAGPVKPAFGDLSSPIRPGSSLGGYCTFDWVFYEALEPTPEDPQPVPDVFIGTAGHCTDELGERATLAGFGPIGTVVYDSNVARSTVDFSLIRIDPHLVGKTNPQMRGFVGPRGVATTDMLAELDRVDVYGYGIVVGSREETRPRWGVLTDWRENEYVADMPAVNGDSGAPLLHDETGYALGVISRYGISEVPPSTDVGPLVTWALQEIRAAGFTNVVLATID